MNEQSKELADTLRIKAPYLNNEWPAWADLMRQAAARIEYLGHEHEVLEDIYNRASVALSRATCPEVKPTAPDLLEALREMLREYEPVGDDVPDAVILARTALARAAGSERAP